MMTSTSKIDLASQFPGMATRPMGSRALEDASAALNETEVVELDFGGVSVSPSFADQLVGGLVAKLGYGQFRKRVRIINARDDVQVLLRHVILRKVVPPPGR